jgi:hypothetical protein
MNLTKKKMVFSFYMLCFAKNATHLKYSFQLLIDPSFFLHFLHTTPPHIESAKNLSANRHIEQQIRCRRIEVMSVPLLATIGFLLEEQIAKKVIITSPCNKPIKR